MQVFKTIRHCFWTFIIIESDLCFHKYLVYLWMCRLERISNILWFIILLCWHKQKFCHLMLSLNLVEYIPPPTPLYPYRRRQILARISQLIPSAQQALLLHIWPPRERQPCVGPHKNYNWGWWRIEQDSCTHSLYAGILIYFLIPHRLITAYFAPA